MRQLILHIGMHKTGTTSIQRSLHGLARDGAKYVALGSPNHSGPMAAAFPGTDPRRRRLGPERTPKQAERLKGQIRARLEEDLGQKQFNKFVISGEGIVFLSEKSLREFREVVLRYVDEVRVFAYVRDPVGYGASGLQQRIKGGYAGYKLSQPKYRSKFAPFIEVFGREQFSVKEFARGTLKDNSVVADFCELWGLPFDPTSEVRANESLSEPTIKLLHLFNKAGTPPLPDRTHKQARIDMVAAINGHFKGKFDLPVRFRPGTIDRDDIDWLASEFGIAFPVDPSLGTRMPLGEFQAYLDAIDPEVVASYRCLLEQGGIHVGPADTVVDLLNKHFAHCLAQASAAPPRQRHVVKHLLAAGLKAFRP